MSDCASLLVVDDNENNRDVLSRRLASKGYDVAVAATGEEALARVESGAYDLILLDVEMPGISGFDVLTCIRQTHSSTEVPVIMVTARADGADIIEAFRRGTNDYVTKPIDFPVALARIGTHLAHKRALEDLQESEERYALAMQGANDGLWDWNLIANEVYGSGRWKSMLGYNESEVGTGRDEWFSRVHEDERGRNHARRQALTESCRQMAAWQAQFGELAPRVVCVNVSSRQFADVDLASEVEAVLRETGLPARQLKLEITESAFMGDVRAAQVALKRLQAIGVEWSLDDFGTGYSSLNHLHQLHVSTVKIDRSFVSRLGVDEGGAEMVRVIVALAHNLSMDVVAEGVESAEQFASLRSLGCEYTQGFHFSKPVDVASAEQLISSQPWSVAALAYW